MKKLLVIPVFTLVAILVFAYFFFNKPALSQTPQGAIESTPSTQPAPTFPPIEQFIKTNPDTTLLKSSGSSYLDPNEKFSFLYPNDYIIDTQNDGQYTRVFKRGSTQKGQTEINDGVLIVFETIELENRSLKDFTTSRIEKMKLDDSSIIVSELKPVLLNTYTGLVYEIQAFGDSMHLIIQKSENSNFALEITYSINDPQNQNYLHEVDEIFSTIQLLK